MVLDPQRRDAVDYVSRGLVLPELRRRTFQRDHEQQLDSSPGGDRLMQIRPADSYQHTCLETPRYQCPACAWENFGKED